MADIPQYSVTVTVQAGERYSGWSTRGETRVTIEIPDLAKLPKLGTITDNLLQSAVSEYHLKKAEEALAEVSDDSDES